MLDRDMEVIKLCETGEVSSALYISPTNRQVHEHNLMQLFKSCPNYVEIDARDFNSKKKQKTKKTGMFELFSGHHSRAYMIHAWMRNCFWQ